MKISLKKAFKKGHSRVLKIPWKKENDTEECLKSLGEVNEKAWKAVMSKQACSLKILAELLFYWMCQLANLGMARKWLKNGQCKCLKNGQENAWKWQGKCLKNGQCKCLEMARKMLEKWPVQLFMELWWYHRCLNRNRPCNVNSAWVLGSLVACLSVFWCGLFAFV